MMMFMEILMVMVMAMFMEILMVMVPMRVVISWTMVVCIIAPHLPNSTNSFQASEQYPSFGLRLILPQKEEKIELLFTCDYRETQQSQKW